MSTTYTQANRPISVTTPLGADKLLLEEFTGTEGISKLFKYQLNMLYQSETPPDFSSILGQSVTVTIEMATKSKRYFNGIVTAFREGAMVRGASLANSLIRYQADLSPMFWTLQKKVQSRIFQHLSVPDILTQVLTGVTIRNEIQGTFEPRDYCVQYRESDYDFASRLMEEEGIFYFFEHADGAHTMVLGNSSTSHQPIPDPASIIYRRPEAAPAPGEEIQDRILLWRKSQEIRSGAYTLWDSSFEKPGETFEAKEKILATATAGTISHKLAVGGNDAFEIYQYPGEYAQRFDGVDKGGAPQPPEIDKISKDNVRTVKLRMEAEAVEGLIVAGKGKCRNFMTGSKFTLTDHFDANGDWLITEVEHEANLEGAYDSNRGAMRLKYQNAFKAIPFAVPFRPQRSTPKPTVKGCQTAVVVGPAGQEIFTDKYGRVKVQFPWDRLGKFDADSSCWLRVGSIWAGKQWGWISIPRIGQEVIVDFLEGDPDQPIVVGSVYNAEQMPHYLLPDNMKYSGIKTNSTLGGKGFNEIRFDDTFEKEEVFIHAQKDLNERILGSRTLVVGKDDKGAAAGSQFEEVWIDSHRHVKQDVVEHIEGSIKFKIGAGEGKVPGKIDGFIEKDVTAKIGGDLKLLVGPDGGNADVVIKAVAKLLVVSDYNEHVQGNHNEKVDAKYSLETGGDLHIKVGGALVIQSTGDVSIKGPNITLAADTKMSISGGGGGSFVVCDASAVAVVGATVKLNSGGSAGTATAASPTAPVDAVDAAPVDAVPTIPPEVVLSSTGFKSAAK